jgi:hypothetical protein
MWWVNEWQWLGGSDVNRKRSSVRLFWCFFQGDWCIIERDAGLLLFFFVVVFFFFLNGHYKVGKNLNIGYCLLTFQAHFYLIFAHFCLFRPIFINFRQFSSIFALISPNFINFCLFSPIFAEFSSISPYFSAIFLYIFPGCSTRSFRLRMFTSWLGSRIRRRSWCGRRSRGGGWWLGGSDGLTSGSGWVAVVSIERGARCGHFGG